MKKILVPTDFSPNAKHALHVAATIATKTQAQLALMHSNTAVAYTSMPESAFAGINDPTDYYGIAADEFRLLKKGLTAEPAFSKLEIETRVEEGHLYAAVRRVVEEEEADLVVMGTKGAHGAAEFFVGSNTEKVIRTVPCPVLAVPESSGTFELKTVVLATTLEKDQAAAFRQLAIWQRYWPFKINVLYLNNPGLFASDEDIKKAALAFAIDAGVKNVHTYISGNTFDEEGTILKFAQKENADLIVMATHQRKGLSHLLFGSLTEDTVNHSPIPVLSVPVKVVN